MRVIIQRRSLSPAGEGGDSTVAKQLYHQLQALGVEVLLQERPTDVRPGDAVHLTNLDRSVLSETEDFVRAASKAGARIVLTPLWWPLQAYTSTLSVHRRLAFHARGNPIARTLRDRRWRSLRSLHARQRHVLGAVHAVCPSGPTEAFVLQSEFGRLPIVEAHRFGSEAPDGIESGPTERTGVLCVGRLDPRKNQLNLIRALRDTPIPLDLVGTDRVFPGYAADCRAAAGPNVRFLGYVPRAELQRAYGKARVHALPSVFELPGLTSLDAAAAGAAVVVSIAGTPCDYFGRDAWYCDTDVASIRCAVLSAYEEGPPPGLRERIVREFTWQRTATTCLRAYGAPA